MKADSPPVPEKKTRMALVAAEPNWIKLPNMPLLSNIFLPTAPVPKTSEEVNFAAALCRASARGARRW